VIFNRMLSVGVLAIALIALATFLERESFGQDVSSPPAKRLQERVKDYYRALVNNEFETVWTVFLGTGMKRDTPKEEYVDILKKTVGSSKLVPGSSEIVIGKTGTGKRERPLGKAFTPIKVMTREGETIEAHHTTIWVWQERPTGKRDWVLAGDEMRESEKKW